MFKAFYSLYVNALIEYFLGGYDTVLIGGADDVHTLSQLIDLTTIDGVDLDSVQLGAGLDLLDR